MSTPPPDAHRRWIEARERALRDPDGWLSLVALHWLAPGTTTITAEGTPDERRVVLPGAVDTPAVILELDDAGLRFDPAPGVQATLDGREATPGTPQPLVDDRDGPAPVLRVGRLHITHIHRHDRPALRIRDREAPTRTRFRGVPRFDFDPTLVVEARFEPAAEGATMPVTLVTEFVESHPIAGTLHFELEGTTHSLVAERSGAGLFVVFGDRTNREPGVDGTYGGGRFLSLKAPDAEGRVEIDFNRATNPPCAFTPHATCPTPSAGNRLPVAIRAGERRPH